MWSVTLEGHLETLTEADDAYICDSGPLPGAAPRETATREPRGTRRWLLPEVILRREKQPVSSQETGERNGFTYKTVSS